MRFDTLQGWLDWQQTLSPIAIDLGLERVREVYERLNLSAIAKQVITVAGTNGKGSTVAFYESWLKHNGLRVASYTSPHLLHYNERIRLNLQPASDAALCEAFARIDEAREDIRLTYFEFGTLAALLLMAQFTPDVALLEVGLGGRLDAVNIIDADLAHLTPIGLDHQDWLGETLELIAQEKAGILRARQNVVINMPDPPQSLLKIVDELSCHAWLLGTDYHYQWLPDGSIQWQSAQRQLTLKPSMAGNHQGLNVAGVLAGLEALGLLEALSDEQVAAGFQHAQCIGRLQTLVAPVDFKLIVDVGHNIDAARVLADALQSMPEQGSKVLLLGMLADKDVSGFVQSLSTVVDEIWLLTLVGERAQTSQQLAQRISDCTLPMLSFESADDALQHAVSSLTNQDILMACGSFLTVEAVLNSTTLTSAQHSRT